MVSGGAGGRSSVPELVGLDMDLKDIYLGIVLDNIYTYFAPRFGKLFRADLSFDSSGGHYRTYCITEEV
jgi:hypothetical protein